jgi:acylphosphatase
MNYESIHVFVQGIVQGVGFRYHASREATDLKLSGWVRNLPDGRVEIYAEGLPSSLDRLLTWVHQGPPSAEVEAVSVHERKTIAQPTLHRFEIR